MQFFFDRYAKDAFNKSVVTNANVLRCVFHLKSHREESWKINEKKNTKIQLSFFSYKNFKIFVQIVLLAMLKFYKSVSFFSVFFPLFYCYIL